MLRNEAFALGGAPGHATKDAAVLFERHLEVTVLQTPRAIDDLDTARPEDRARISRTERRQRGELRDGLLVDGPERQRAIDPEARAQIVGCQARIGEVVDARAQFANA